MYAIVKTGGKQYRVAQGDVLKVEKIKSEDKEFEIKEVLMVSNGEKKIFGNPYVDGASVKCEILEKGHNKKVLVFKQKPRKNHRKLYGHRQPYTKVKIKEIVLEG
ncbi:MAG: 50S ribosomal protein L21 [Nitrospirae bacterium]|nr:MAG: 50S ribosomal protein L21 [Nitrospirota bacterium]